MDARTVVVTGASDGIGAEAARELAAAGDHVVVVGRSPAKTAALATELGTDHLVADFSRLDDVRVLADAPLAGCPRIDVLANNAGAIFAGTRSTTTDGHESTFQVNYLAPFLLTELLHDRLVESRATVVNTSSIAGGRFGRLDLDNLESTRGYSAARAYGSSKLAQTAPGTDWQPGGYYAKRRLRRTVAQADDAALAAGLWDRSIAMLGLG